MDWGPQQNLPTDRADFIVANDLETFKASGKLDKVGVSPLSPPKEKMKKRKRKTHVLRPCVRQLERAVHPPFVYRSRGYAQVQCLVFVAAGGDKALMEPLFKALPACKWVHSFFAGVDALVRGKPRIYGRSNFKASGYVWFLRSDG